MNATGTSYVAGCLRHFTYTGHHLLTSQPLKGENWNQRCDVSMITVSGRARIWGQDWRIPKPQTFSWTLILPLASWALRMENLGLPKASLSSACFTRSLWRLPFSASLLLQLSQDPAGNRTTIATVTEAIWKIQHSFGQGGRAWVKRDRKCMHACTQARRCTCRIKIIEL